MTLLYLACLAGLLAAISHFGQANLTTAALMYLPPWTWISPTLLLLPLALVSDRKSFLGLALALPLFFNGYLDFQWRSSAKPPSSTKTIRLFTWNSGQGKHTSLGSLKDSLRPDFILLQDAEHRGPKLKTDKRFADFTGISVIGEFVLLSRWPIISSEAVGSSHLITHGTPRTNPCAARYVVSVEGRQIVIYTVHFPSPRDSLESYRRGSFMWGILGIPGTPWEAKKKHYQSFWDEQIFLAQDILQRTQSETGPLLIAGDFNTPVLGPIYRMYAEKFHDAHHEGGKGLGFTFPGDGHFPVSLIQPWLRLDQIFTSAEWRVASCAPQPTNAQHWPVLVELTLADSPP